jgi:hypothetical protein
MKLEIKRAIYGKDNTPIELREYKLVGYNSPVGTIKEWKEFAKQHKYNGVRIIEKDGTIKEERI